MISKVAIITPYYKEAPEVLQRCIQSVREQTMACEHILVADGYPLSDELILGTRQIRLDKSHGDYGNTPRGIGAQVAISEGYDAICFLDADCWLDKNHVSAIYTLLSGLEICPDFLIAKRRFMRPDGSEMIGEEEEAGHVDTNCYVMLPGSFSLVPFFSMMPKGLSFKGDRHFLQLLLSHRKTYFHLNCKTVNYTYTWPSRYLRRQECFPCEVKNVEQQQIEYNNYVKNIPLKDATILRSFGLLKS